MTGYKEKIRSIDTSGYQEKLRKAMQESYPGHDKLDFSAMIEVCSRRALTIWNQNIVVDLDIPLQREFERNLPKIKMRAGISIPRIFLFGYAFGLACHCLSHGKQDNQLDVGATSGLYMFILGLFDNLLDDYPEFFGNMGESYKKESIENYILKQKYDQLVEYADNPLAQGMAQLYKTYFIKCHRIASDNSKILTTWCDELKRMHKVEAESLDRRMNKVAPSQAIIEQAVQPSLSAFRVLALSACLEHDEFINENVETFAKDYAELTWLVDDISDLEKDLDEDIWSGLAVRLATEVDNKADADKLIADISKQAVATVESMYELLKDYKWHPDDEFSLADILWYVIWSWCGGVIETKETVAVA